MTKSADCDDAETLRRRVVRLEDALAESKTRLQAVIDAAPSLIFVRDRDGRYVVSNREFARLHGLEPQDVEGKTPYDFCPTDVAEGYIAADRRVMEAAQSNTWQEDITYKDGTVRTVLATKFPVLGLGGDVVGVGVVSTDVTDLERTDQSPSPQSKEPLAGGFVHRFNHLLAAVIGNLGLHRDDGGR
ncbi:MAG: PAS domain-containing protein [Rhodospirillales bacterium]|nr:PAS domain-containing protein [Rhodospirillales bacterium]